MMDFTPKQIAEMHDRNENFSGKTANLSKMQTYNRIKNNLIAIFEKGKDVYRIEESAPRQHKQNAVIALDIDRISIYDNETACILAETMKMADRLVFSALEKHIRISFGVENIWKD